MVVLDTEERVGVEDGWEDVEVDDEIKLLLLLVILGEERFDLGSDEQLRESLCVVLLLGLVILLLLFDETL